MRTVRLRLYVSHKPASEVYAALADFGRYPELCDGVRDVAVTEVSENRTVSRWEVTFRAGLLRWTEEDMFDPGALSITFHQIEGDIAVFDGSWQCLDNVPSVPGSEIVFSARLDMGIPSLADALEPIAVRTLIDNTVLIVRGLVGDAEIVASEVAQNRTVSRWEVTFRAGLLRWTEEDTFDPDALSITFRQLEGDIAVFDGSWECLDAAQGCEIVFSCLLYTSPSPRD